MRITNIKHKNGSKLSTLEMGKLIEELAVKFHNAGFMTGVYAANSSAVNISAGMKCFTVDTNKLGYNARVNEFTVSKTKKGYARSNIPTWTQREEFNHLLNNVLDSLKLNAHIKSGEYVVRTVTGGRVNHWDMPEVYRNGYRLQCPRALEIVPIKYAENAVEWVGIDAPFIAAVPEQTPKYLPRRLRLAKSA